MEHQANLYSKLQCLIVLIKAEMSECEYHSFIIKYYILVNSYEQLRTTVPFNISVATYLKYSPLKLVK